MATDVKVYTVEDADPGHSSGIPAGTFPGTLAGLLDALDAAHFRSAAARTEMQVPIVEGEQRQVIRKFQRGTETWSASTAEIRRQEDPHD